MSAGRAPDLVEALIGYRAWRADDRGRLHPWSLSAAGAWVPGVNTASCHASTYDPSRAGRRAHRPPVARCMCGLYALASERDHRLHGRDGQVVGAIAAWGDVQIHATGFRAEHAAIVALAEPGPFSRSRAAARAAAAHYGVALVPREELVGAAAPYGRPLDPALLEEPDPRAPLRRERRVADRGIALDHHVWAEPDLDHVSIGLTGAFRRLVGDGAEVTAPPPGTPVAPGDILATVTGEDGRTYLVWCLVAGSVLRVAERAGAGWLVQVGDTQWARDQQRFTWGARGRTHYEAQLASAAATGRDVFAEILGERLFHAPRVSSGADVLRELRRLAAQPEFASADELYAACREPVHERLAREPDAAARAARAGATVRFLTTEPDGTLTLHARSERVALVCGPSAEPADIVLRATGEDAARFFRGKLDVAQALRSRRLSSDASPARTLQVLSVLKHALPAPAG